MADINPQSPKKPAYIPRGSANTFDLGKYNIDSYSYPIDLMSSNYGDNYVVFYINVASDSKLFNDQTIESVDLDQTEARDRGDLIAQNLDKQTLIGSIATANTLAGIVGGSIALKGDNAAQKAANASKGAVVANIPTLGLAAAANVAASTTRQQKRLKTAIALHIPNQLQIRYGMQWSEEETGLVAMGAAGIDEIMKAIEGKNKMSDVTGTGAAIIANLALSKAPAGQAAATSVATGLAANPKKEQVFKGVDFRTFSFDYQFFPRDADEAQNVLNIIQQFKYHMHPEFKDDNNFVYIYPSEFDIFYYQGRSENLNLHRHTSCVLTEMNINYTPNGTFTTFDNGMPTQINVTMSFRELALLTKEKVKDGL
jgi:hypothetical protein